ncbi:hypothetical protein UA08_01526 [Talaromyces atroroseus]|uniref:Uncharacterized protein n=1 Tax=Talaromyces atroroseus TaxID=1441469 RepID=A0A1Q5QA38_TALAT|nr:hypothetical protein UA08_01526 [Talaromyces atroroseus]OKL62792.1 hypothetical protein UA08_01526 [Talaromyces atroroseus]
MPSRVGAHLTPISSSVDLQHGMGFVVKYRNNAINAMDLWLGIHVPSNVAPKTLTTKPRKNAGTDTPAAERAYMFYMPGRNSYAWIERKSLYPLSELSPEEFNLEDRADSWLYAKLYDLIEDYGNDLQFWIDMATKERQQKGSSSKQPYLVLPYADRDESESNALDESSDKEQSPPAKRNPKETHARPANKKAKAASLPDPLLNGEEIVQIYIGNAATLQKIFQLTRNNIRKSSFLEGLIQGNPPFIFHPTLFQMSPDEFETVHAYLSTDDDADSDLVHVGDSIEKLVGEDHILGDALKIGRTYTLKNLKGIEDLTELIPRLGKLYKKACLLNLDKMSKSTILKLQVVWNIYCGAPQLPLFLDFIESIMPHLPPMHPSRNVFVGHTAQAPPFGSPLASSLSCSQQQWIIDFLAETMMLYLATDLQRFCNFMQQYAWMQAVVYERRAQFCNAHLGDLSRLEMALMQREPFDETIIVRFEEAQQEAQAEEQEEKGEQADDTEALFC